jgi:hypothetical protein
VVSGLAAGIVAVAWAILVSDGVFAENLWFHLTRIGTRSAGMWSIDSGFADIRRFTGINTPLQLAVSSLKDFYQFPGRYMPFAFFVTSLLGLPIWITRCARSHLALRAFTVMWPLSYVLVNFVVFDFVSPRYFIPFLAWSAFLLAGLVWLAERYVPAWATAASFAVLGVALVAHLRAALGGERDPWFYGRADWITREHASVVSFTPMLFAATGAEPGCGLANPALAYGDFGVQLLVTEHARRFRIADTQLIDCLRANRETRVVIDWGFYFFTRPGSALRDYLHGEGSEQKLFFSPEALEQWDRPVFAMRPFR